MRGIRLWIVALTISVIGLAWVPCAVADDAKSNENRVAKVFFDETFKDAKGAWVSGDASAKGGHLELQCTEGTKYNGSQVAFPAALKVPQTREGVLKLQFTIEGIDSPNGGYSARFALLPEAMAGQWVEPYGREHVLALYIDGDANGVAISLYGNDGSDKGFGKLLYSGGGSGKPFPLPVTLQVDSDNFYIQFGAEVETKSGSKSGHHGLVASKWQGDAGFAIRLVTLADGNKPKLYLGRTTAAIEIPSQPISPLGATRPRETSPIEATIQVHPTITQSIGGYDKVQPLFGGNANGSSRGKADALIRELNLNTSRLHMWPDTYGAPKEMQSPISPAFAAQMGAALTNSRMPTNGCTGLGEGGQIGGAV